MPAQSATWFVTTAKRFGGWQNFVQHCPDPGVWRTSADNGWEPKGTGLPCRPEARNRLRIGGKRPRNDGNRRGPTHPTL